MPGLGPARLEALDRLGLVVRRPPHARALREDLHAVAADRLDPVDRRVDSPAGRHVRAEFHRRPTIERWQTSASAWHRARPASSTSAASARSSSTGSSRGSRAASACCGSRTRTRAARCEAATAQIQESLRWLGIDWDGPVTFQLDNLETCQKLARPAARRRARPTRTRARSASACRTRASTVVGRRRARPHRVPNEELDDLVIVRSDGRPTYNFVEPGRRHASTASRT